MIPHRGAGLLLLLGLLAAVGCDDQVQAPAPSTPDLRSDAMVGAQGALNQFPALVDSILEVRFDLAKDPLAPERDDAGLADAVRKGGGRVTIGLKPANAPRTRTTGVYPAMTRAAALQLRAEIESHGIRIVRTFRHSASVVADVRPEMAAMVRQLPIVNYVVPVAAVRLAQDPPPQDTSWGVIRVAAALAWTYFSNWGQLADITMLDSGVDEDHLFGGGGDGPESVFAGDCMYDSGYYTACYDDRPHGAHVAGIIASRNNESGMIGIAYAPLRFASVKVCGANGGCPTDAVASGLDWTVGNGRPRQVVNMSLGDSVDHEDIREFSLRSADAGNLLIAAAGNHYEVGANHAVVYPARYSWVMAVSGVLEDDTSPDASYWCANELSPDYVGSNWGPEVEVTAPFWARSMKLDGTYGIDCGTSMATPVVSSIAAMVWTRNPSWTASQVRNRINATAWDLWPPGRDEHFGYGRVNAYYALSDQPPPPYTASISGASEVQPYATCSWSVTTDLPSPPYTYAWWVDNVLQDDEDWWFTYNIGSASFQIMARVTDAEGRFAWDVYDVGVSWYAEECLDTKR